MVVIIIMLLPLLVVLVLYYCGNRVSILYNVQCTSMWVLRTILRDNNTHDCIDDSVMNVKATMAECVCMCMVSAQCCTNIVYNRHGACSHRLPSSSTDYNSTIYIFIYVCVCVYAAMVCSCSVIVWVLLLLYSTVQWDAVL